MVDLAVAFGKHLGLTAVDLKSLEIGAGLHDIGKFEIPEAILFKNGRLTDEERAVIEGHPLLGYNLLKKLGFKDGDVLQIVLQHHENVDGSGYPMRTTEINKLAKIVALCDVFEALTAKRCYKPAMELEEALTIIKKDIGNKFDRELGNKFINFIRSSWVKNNRVLEEMA